MSTSRMQLDNRWDTGDLLDSLWRALSSPYVCALLLVLAAAATCLMFVFPQRPPEALADPTANSQWLSALQERYGALSQWLIRLGCVDLPRSLWYRSLVGGLALSLLVGTIRLLRPSQLLAPSSDSVSLSSSGNWHDATPHIQRAVEVLQEHHFRVLPGSIEGVAYADRHIWSSILLRLGVLLVIGGAVISERTAWRQEGFVLRPGELRLLARGTDLAASAKVLDSSNSQQAPAGAEPTELVLLRQNREVWRTILRGRLPAFGAGLYFVRTTTEPALLLTAKDSDGETVGLQTPETGTTEFREVTLRFLKDESPRYIVALASATGSPLTRQFQQRGNERYVLIPSHDLVLRVTYHGPESAAIAALFYVEAFQGHDSLPLEQVEVYHSRVLALDGARLQLEPQRYAVLTYGQDYGLMVVLLGAFGSLAGLALSLWRPAQRLSLVFQTANGQVNLLLGRAPQIGRRATRWFPDTVQALATALELTTLGELQGPPAPSIGNSQI